MGVLLKTFNVGLPATAATVHEQNTLKVVLKAVLSHGFFVSKMRNSSRIFLVYS
jgi:hypothetical protein